MIRAANDPTRAAGRPLAAAEIIVDLVELELEDAAAGYGNPAHAADLLERLRRARQELRTAVGRHDAKTVAARAATIPSRTELL